MVVVMGSSTALCVSISSAAAPNSFKCPSRPSPTADHQGYRSVRPLMLPMVQKCGPLGSSSTLADSSGKRWMKEMSSGGAIKLRAVRVRASSSSEESSDEKGQVNTEKVPGWAKSDSAELPPWAKNERAASQEPAEDLPFPVYLIGSVIVAIAAVGSVFEYFNQNPIFGVVKPDNPLYTPILGFFAVSGLPSAGFLFVKSIQLANKASAEADKEDGFPR